jgi:membrane protein
VAAEETIQLPPRDSRNIDKAQAKRLDDVRRGRQLRVGRNRHRATTDEDR